MILASMDPLKELSSAGERGRADPECFTFHPVIDVDGVTAACHTNGGNIDGCRAVAANHILAVLVVALTATDGTGIQRRAERVRGV